jgi:hypothetical protein
MIETQSNSTYEEVIEQAVACPHCPKSWKIKIAPKRGKMDHYSIECLDCGRPWSKALAGEIIEGP